MDIMPFSYQIIPAWVYHAMHHPYEQDCQYKGFAVKENFGAIKAVYKKLADDFSRRTYLDVLMFRLTLDVGYLKDCSLKPDEQYFIPELKGLGENEVVADCGAFTGDTLEAYLKHNDIPKRYYLYEADKEKEAGILNKVKELGVEEKCVLRNVGVSETCGTLSFVGGMSGGAHFAEDREKDNGKCHAINVVSLDSDIAEDVTLIKMDIEGAEMAALKGCVEKLKTRPKLAISVYHKIEDLWQIPQFLFGFYPEGTKYIVRHYNDIGRAETVFFAILEK